MFKLFKKSGAAQLQSVTDTVLGNLLLSEKGKWWDGSVRVGEYVVGFKIGGSGGPDGRLLEHAHDIVHSFINFRTGVREFLEKEASQVKHLKPFAEEIRQLEIEDVCLFWPKRPHDGMIYFRGPDQYRIWRCDYVDREPRGLGFDD